MHIPESVAPATTPCSTILNWRTPVQAGIDHHHKLAMATSNNGSSSFGGSTSRANSPACHIKCFLCDVPCGPWGIIYDFCEPVCRACCNYEGIERISEVINEARRMRHSLEQYPRQQKPPSSSSLPHQHILTRSMGTNELTAFSSSVRGCSGMAAPVVPVAHFSTAAGYHITSNTGKPSFAIPMADTASLCPPGLESQQPSAATWPFSPLVQKPIKVHQQQETQLQHLAQQVHDNLLILSNILPFRIRFCKDHSLVGRVIAFDAVPICRWWEDKSIKFHYELMVLWSTQLARVQSLIAPAR